ncbi:hypothetical protein [Streptomyces sp. NPDC058657]|uniref:hypothetical protein n=1 Tax=unclassified Streptomyces TaxID=2593676 RepID=UPI0036486C0B
MLTETAHEDFPAFLRRPALRSPDLRSPAFRRPSFWPRVREFAVPPAMIEAATARRLAGDWAGACAAARFDVDLNLRTAERTWGAELAALVRDDLRHLAPDLLRWHLPRIAPDGLLRPGLTMALASYGAAGGGGGHVVHLVVRTPPARADAGQRVSLALWDGTGGDAGAPGPSSSRYPHPHPDRRFRLDVHRHLWDARRAGELRIRSGAELPASSGGSGPEPVAPHAAPSTADLFAVVPEGHPCAVGRWAAEARLVLLAEGRTSGSVTVRLSHRHRLLLELPEHDAGLRLSALSADNKSAALPVLPDAATWVLPDLELLRTGAVVAGQLHPLVASALVPDAAVAGVRGAGAPVPPRAGAPHLVECRGARHRIALVDGVLAALDHDPAELRREELLVALNGPPLPCLRVIDEAHRSPECLNGVRERLAHGDITGALAVVEGLLGPQAVLRDGALRDELAAVARRKVAYGLFRAGLSGPKPGVPRRGKPDWVVRDTGGRQRRDTGRS